MPLKAEDLKNFLNEPSEAEKLARERLELARERLELDKRRQAHREEQDAFERRQAQARAEAQFQKRKERRRRIPIDAIAYAVLSAALLVVYAVSMFFLLK